MLCVGIIVTGAACAWAVEATERKIGYVVRNTQTRSGRAVLRIIGAFLTFGLVFAQMLLSLLLVWFLGEHK